jgi:hypothetical protein
MKHMHHLARAAAAIALLVGTSTRANASTITFTFTGSVTFVNDNIDNGTFSIGDTLTGSLTYDSGLADSNVSPTVGQYAPLSSLSFTIGSYSASFANTVSLVTVTNGPPGSDQLNLRGDVTGATVNNFKPFEMVFALTDSTGQVFSSDALPLAFDTSQFTSATFTFRFTNRANPHDTTTPGTNFAGVQGTLTGIAVADTAPVPEPATLTLLGGGLASIALRLRRKQRPALTKRD